MKLRHIAVGYDGSAGSEEAVRWAVREAAGRDVMVLLVTACPPRVPPAPVTSDERLSPMVRAFSAQQAALARARAALPSGVRPPPVGTEVVPAEPVTALCRAARQADLLVLGGGLGPGLDPGSVPGRVAARLSADRRRGQAPLVVIAAPCGGTPAGPTTGDAPLRVRIGPVPGPKVPVRR
jgi:nucleotide-binding universal stress UspA family protein